MKVILVLTVLMMAVAAVAEDALVFRPAHWVAGEDLEPTYHAFDFYALAFTSPDDGWLVGEKYVLRIQGERLEVAFVGLSDGLRTVSFSSPALGWIGGNGAPNGRFPLLRHGPGGWRRDQIGGMTWPLWGVSEIFAGPLGDAWGTASVSDTSDRSEAWKRSRRVMLRYDGATWTVDDSLLTGHQTVTIHDACQTPAGTWWFVGVDRPTQSSMNAFLAFWDGSTLIRDARSSSEVERSTLDRVRCAADGSVWALGELRPRPGVPREALLLRRVTDWQRVSVPLDLPGEPSTSALAAIDANEAWISANCNYLELPCRERFFHLRNGIWETVELPFLPGGRSTHRFIVDVQFVSPNEGWAIASDSKPRDGGRIYHYRDGVWRNRNWNWHFWDAPGFGLFGY